MTAITEDWLKEIGFKWFDVERSTRHWLLWMGPCTAHNPNRQRSASFDDFGLEISKFIEKEEVWSVFYRADYAGRYTRFIYVRDVWEREQLIRLIEAITDVPFDKENVLYGTLYQPEQMAHYREEQAHRLDRQIAFGNRWRTDEKDDSKAVKESDRHGPETV